ncbi:MAG TPA: hypothetical protein VMU77_08040 [Acidimicrobiales bacterium]|nr:hypothetical protein [Acidimicrobiales bacterium]
MKDSGYTRLDKSIYSSRRVPRRRLFGTILAVAVVLSIWGLALGIPRLHLALDGATKYSLDPIVISNNTNKDRVETLYSVGVVTQQLTEVPASGSASISGSRYITLILRYPASGPPDSAELPGARPYTVNSPYPLVIFSPGFDIASGRYAVLLDSWVKAGFVVAEPEYPYTDPSYPGGVDESDIVNHPGDLSFVISTLLGDANQATSVLYKLIDPTKVIAAGQSDGGDVSLAAVDNGCCRDTRISAAMILSGAEYSAFPGSYFKSNSIPMLITQGTNDLINPEFCSVQIYNQAPSPKYYLSLLGANHLEPYTGPGPYEEITAQVTTDFLIKITNGLAAGPDQMSVSGNVPGLSTFTSAPSVPPVGGSCPGAPGS